MSDASATPTMLSRRRLLVAAGGGAATLAAPGLVNPALAKRAKLPAGQELFTLGVASGDPLPHGVVLWTRLAPDPLNGGGMPQIPVPVLWEVAHDERFRRVVQRGVAFALPRFAHSVHVDVRGLGSDRWFFYRFRVPGGGFSPVGRTRTAPHPASSPAGLRFAFVSCQDWQNGYWPAYDHLAQEELDLVVHLGDYIYEYSADPAAVRQHDGPEVGGLVSYRNRHALYKGDPALQAAHAACPWMLTWDDHEVENDYAGLIEEPPVAPEQPEDFAARRAAAYQAYYEHMPLRRSSLPQGPDLHLYRRLRHGTLAEFSLLDTRQYRSDQPCGNELLAPRCAAALADSQTMTGPEQEQWLLQGLADSHARWNVVAQQTMFGQGKFFVPNVPFPLFNLDQWDGYVAARNRILAFIEQERPSNPVIISGDIHSSWVHDIKADFDEPSSETLATEFVGTSISSDFPAAFIPLVQAALPANPHIKYFEGAHRGYAVCNLDAERWRTDFRAVASTATPTSPVSTIASFEVENGAPGAHPA